MQYEACEIVEVDFYSKKVVARHVNFDQIERQRLYDTYMQAALAWKMKGMDAMMHKEQALIAMQHPYCDIKLHHAVAVKEEERAKLYYQIAEDFLKKAELEALYATC